MNLDADSHSGASLRGDEGPIDSRQGPTPWRSWLIDLTLAYLGGLTIGAPLGLLTAKYFDTPTAIDLVVLAVMLLTVASLRARRTQAAMATPREREMAQITKDIDHQREVDATLGRQRSRRRA